MLAISSDKSRHLLVVGGYARTSYVERHPRVEVVRHRLAFCQPELTNVEAMVGRVQNVGVVQLADLLQHGHELESERKVVLEILSSFAISVRPAVPNNQNALFSIKKAINKNFQRMET